MWVSFFTDMSSIDVEFIYFVTRAVKNLKEYLKTNEVEITKFDCKIDSAGSLLSFDLELDSM